MGRPARLVIVQPSPVHVRSGVPDRKVRPKPPVVQSSSEPKSSKWGRPPSTWQSSQGPCPLLSRSGSKRSSRQRTSSQTFRLSPKRVEQRTSSAISCSSTAVCLPTRSQSVPLMRGTRHGIKTSAPTGEVPEGTSPRLKRDRAAGLFEPASRRSYEIFIIMIS